MIFVKKIQQLPKLDDKRIQTFWSSLARKEIEGIRRNGRSGSQFPKTHLKTRKA